MACRPVPVAALLVALAASLGGPLASSTPAQTVLSQGDIAVATTEGIFVLHPLQGAVRLVPGPLVEPAIEWEPDSDRFYVVTDNLLLHVTVTSFATGGATVQTLATLPAGTRLTDLDVDHTTGDVWLLDKELNQALRFTAPVAQGSAPDLTLQLDVHTRALCVDSVNPPLSLVYAVTKGLRRQTLDGPFVTEGTKKVKTDAGIDATWQHPASGTYVADTDSNRIFFNPIGATTFTITLQYPTMPLLYHPTDVEWLPNSHLVYAVGSDGIKPSAFPGASQVTGVHVVEFRPGGGSVGGGGFGGVPLAVLASEPQGKSLLYGTEADLTIVSDGAFAGVYGNPSPAYTGEAPLLIHYFTPQLGSPDFAVEIVGAPAGRPAYVGLSRSPAAVSVGGGMQWVASPLWMPVGFTGPQGGLFLPASVPNDPALTSMDLYTQAVVFGNDLEPAFTNALRMHFR